MAAAVTLDSSSAMARRSVIDGSIDHFIEAKASAVSSQSSGARHVLARRSRQHMAASANPAR